MKKILAVILVLLIGTGLGCVQRKSGINVSENRSKGYIVYNLGQMPEDLVMLQSTNVREKDILLNIFEGLVKTDDENKIEPGIAESWTISNDGLTYTFRLNKAAKWSDGTTISAEDFVEFFANILKKGTENLYAEQLYCIYGAEDYRKGNRNFDSVAIRATEQGTLQIRLNYPSPYLLSILAEPEFVLRSIDKKLQNYTADYKKINYSGPFKIDDISTNGKITLIRNNDYWNKDKVNSSKLILTTAGTSENALVDFEGSKVDIFTNPPFSEFDRLVQQGKVKIVPSWGTRIIFFNLNSKSPGSNIGFRKAVNSAINRSEICEEVLAGIEKPAGVLIPTTLRSITSGKKSKKFFNIESDEDKAKELYSASKIQVKGNLILAYENEAANKKVSEAAAREISKVLDIKCIAKGFSNKDLLQVLKDGNYDLFLANIDGKYGDSTSFLNNFFSSSKFNAFNFKNSEFDLNFSKIKFEKDSGKKLQLLEKCEEIIMEQFYVLPISFSSTTLCSQNYIEGLIVNERGNIRLDKAYVSLFEN